MKLRKSATTLNILNNVLVTLQVIFVSEILDNSGSFLEGADDAKPNKDGLPLLWETSKSKLHWPHQPYRDRAPENCGRNA